jgi:acetate kinase
VNIFVINSGSSSIKYQLFQMPSTSPICVGLIERVGYGDATITHKTYINGEEKVINETMPIPDYETGLNEVNRLLTDPEIGVIKNTSDITAVGHRIVHGGERFTELTEITPEVKEELKQTFQLAPLHNPSAYKGIEVAEQIFTNATQLAVFDTAFHQTRPAKAYRFALPQSYYTEHHIRGYGFHGTSHKYVSEQAIAYLRKPDAKIISIHLGNGCSMTAIQNGQSLDTSMGFGPLSGLIMGTRTGDIDPTVIFYLVNELGYDINRVSDLVNKQSGMLGLTGFSDMRDITKAIEAGDGNAKLAYDMYAYRIKKFIGSYAAVLNGIDAIIFTAGVGENDAQVRQLACDDMQYLNIHIDREKNYTRQPGIREISTHYSPVKILVVPTNEELEIANQCYARLNS